jgi:NADH:ubiquinone oxidoreductase subunit F (NADH-binding)/NAD-dependent dihydropyrimidine dehydrogenase PreA subunit/(2Fe-2S) ferredoxin
MRISTIGDLENMKQSGLRSIFPPKTKITVGMATCGLATGGGKVYQAISDKLKETGHNAVLAQTGCLGFCQMEPLVEIYVPGKSRIVYKEMTPKKAEELVAGLGNGDLRQEWALCQILDGQGPESLHRKEVQQIPRYEEIDFYKKQVKIALRNCGLVDPRNIEEYIARGGYFPLHKALSTMKPEQVIDQVKKSGLRGRGGAGFPTGIKWEACSKKAGRPKYLVCNADEGDPGAYMDRSILEGDPYSVVEGMTIGAIAMGATTGFIFVRHEYPLAVEHALDALNTAHENGLLGENILGSGVNFDIEIVTSAGAFVCGEETALIHTIEGYIGEPRQRPPYPFEQGIFGKPTCINNVETWANVPVIIAKGGDAYAQKGTRSSKGTKVFSVVGKIKNTGLVEVPMGISIKEIIYNIGGGSSDGHKIKAVQIGGPSGGCIPHSKFDLPIDFDSLTQAGAIMGSGGLIVMDERTCMVDIARYFLSFLEGESCGKCLPCREGIKRMLQIVTRITEGKGEKKDIDRLERLATAVRDGSLCGLGATSPNPVLTTLRYFKDEYEAHINKKRCPAGVCKELITYHINEKCTGCSVCVKECPQQAIKFMGKKKPVILDQSKCIKCGVCFDVCKLDAVEVR